MSIKVKISPALATVDKRIAQRVAVARNAAELLIETQAKQAVRQVGAVASGELLNSIRVLRRAESTSAVGSDTVQAQVVEAGRKPGPVPSWGAFKPILLAWARSKGLSIPEDRLYAVALKIRRAGFKGRFPFRRAAAVAEPQVVRIFERTLEGL